MIKINHNEVEEIDFEENSDEESKEKNDEKKKYIEVMKSKSLSESNERNS